MPDYAQRSPDRQRAANASAHNAVTDATPFRERQPVETGGGTLQAALSGSPRVQAAAQLRRALNGQPRVTDRARLAGLLQRRSSLVAASHSILALEQRMERRAVEGPEEAQGRARADAPAAAANARVIQRVLMRGADELARDAGPIPRKINLDWLALLTAVQRYHQHIDEYRRAQLDRGSVDPALFHDWRDAMNSRIGVVRRHAQTIDALAAERHQHLSNKRIKLGRHTTEMASLAAIRQVAAGVVAVTNTVALADSELKSVHPEVRARLKALGQQNVDEFLRAHSDKTLMASDLAPGSAQANVNAGAVNTVGVATYNPRPGGPIATPITGYTKTGVDESGEEAVSEAGQTIGISMQDPRAALRAVATYRVSELIGLGIIPRTVLTQYTNEQGQQRLGQVMETAVGSTGQGKSGDIRTKVTDPARKRELLAYINVLKAPSDRVRADRLQQAKDAIVGKFVEIRGELYEPFKEAVYNFDWTNPVLQRDMSTLQVFDLLVGHVDRHAGNYIINYDRADKNRIRGVKGIDNDDTFGKHFTNINDQTRRGQGLTSPAISANKPVSKTPNLPPVLDFDTALKLLNTDWNAIAAELATYTITPQEIAATKTRFDVIIQHVIGLAMSDRLASTGPVSYYDRLSLHFALQRHGRAWSTATANVMQWGPATMALQNPSNSYAAEKEQQVATYQSPANPEHIVINEPQYRG